MPINTEFLVRCVDTLEAAFEQLQQHERDDTFYDIFRVASVKEFGLVLEQSRSLLQKRLRPLFASNRQADRLTFKDVFRHAARHGLISAEASERWMVYRDNRNDNRARLRRGVRRGDSRAAADLHQRRPGAGRRHRGGRR